MNYTICGIPMALITHPQGSWLEGINPVTNLQWRKGVDSFWNEGARYCLLEPQIRGEMTVRHLESLQAVFDRVGRDNLPPAWDNQKPNWQYKDSLVVREVSGLGEIALFAWNPTMSSQEFDGDSQPVVDVSWYHAKGWTLAQGGLYLLNDAQWEWSAGKGDLLDSEGGKLAHCSIGRRERKTIEVDDQKYGNGPFGLRHKMGNVSEWVERNPGAKHPYGLRGGSWNDSHPQDLHPDIRKDERPDYHDIRTGFRVGAAFHSQFLREKNS